MLYYKNLNHVKGVTVAAVSGWLKFPTGHIICSGCNGNCKPKQRVVFFGQRSAQNIARALKYKGIPNFTFKDEIRALLSP